MTGILLVFALVAVLWALVISVLVLIGVIIERFFIAKLDRAISKRTGL